MFMVLNFQNKLPKWKILSGNNLWSFLQKKSLKNWPTQYKKMTPKNIIFDSNWQQRWKSVEAAMGCLEGF